MSNFNFGQFRRNLASEYVTNLSYETGDILTPASFSEAINFKDFAIKLSGENILQPLDETRTKAKNYYIKFKVYSKLEKEQIITIKLKNTNKEKDNEQYLKTITIPAGEENNYFSFDLIISPNSTYNEIDFILNRIADDFNQQNEDGSYGRTLKIEPVYYQEVINIIDKYINSSINNTGILKQIGVQGKPGTIMCIEGEQIRIGRTGIYEINNGTFISFLGFVVQESDTNNFFVDYQY